MTSIRVNPGSVKTYGTNASTKFQEISAELKMLVSDCVEVHYYGANAKQFKEQCGQLAADFANKLHKDMSTIADAVRSSTTNISKALGGQPIVIAIDNSPVSVPSVAAVDYVDVDPSALVMLKSTVDRHFTRIVERLNGHLSDLKSTDWQGKAKEGAVAEISAFTQKAVSASQEASKSIGTYIQAQYDAAMAADK